MTDLDKKIIVDHEQLSSKHEAASHRL